jgi:hypothetical protein
MFDSPTLLLLVLTGIGPAGPDTVPGHAYYPLDIGDRWTYESALRGRFTNEVEDTVRIEGVLHHRVASADAGGGRTHFHTRIEGGRVYHRAPAGADLLVVDLSLAPGESFRSSDGPAATTVTFLSEHDTLTVLGTPYRDVRVYRNQGPGGLHDIHVVRGIGIVGMTRADGGVLSRLLEARVGGQPFTAAEGKPTGIEAATLSPAQAASLGLLGRVWGFVKYHHPAVTGGDVDWDTRLFDIVPELLGAEPQGVPALLDAWLAELGDPPPCEPCAELPGDLHIEPEIAWIHDAGRLGATLSDRLVRIHARRSAAPDQRYVSHAPGVGNPVFTGEDAYVGVAEPDAGHRLLGLLRYWNIIRYWFPYRDLLDDDWDDVLREFIPRVMADIDTDAYRLAMLELATRTQDTHAMIPQAHAVRPPRGGGQLPVVVRFIDGHAVVAGYSHAELGPATGLRPGDILTHLDRAPVDSLVAEWSRFHAASNEPARLRSIARTLTRGSEGPVQVSGLRDGIPFERTVERAPIANLDPLAGDTHDLPGETFQMLADDVGYLKLSAVRVADVPDYIRQARDAAVLVVDIRNYPSEFVPFALGGRLVPEPTPFARFTVGDAANPGAFRWGSVVQVRPIPGDRFEGAVVILVDETSISQSEYTAMALRAAPGAIVVGSTTAGADGNISRIPLPGGMEALITGIGVFYPDRTPTQRIGIVPDLVVRPTVEGIRDGRDEVLEAGVSHALGREFRLGR